MTTDILELAKLFDEITPEPEDEDQPVVYEQKIEPAEKESFWDDDEITPVGFYKDDQDDRPEPPYEIRYRQSLNAADGVLLTNFNDPSRTNCDTIILVVKLDIDTPEDIDLHVQGGYLDLRTPKQRLTLTFDVPTKGNEAKAQWKEEEKELQIEIPMIPAEMKFV